MSIWESGSRGISKPIIRIISLLVAHFSITRLVEFVTKTRKPLARRWSCQLTMQNPFNACLVVCGRALLRTSLVERRVSTNCLSEPWFENAELPTYKCRPENLFVELIIWANGILGKVWGYHKALSSRTLPKIRQWNFRCVRAETVARTPARTADFYPPPSPRRRSTF